MQFQKKTSTGAFSSVGKILIKIVLFILLIVIAIILIERINFPSPNKKIEKIIPNENLKTVK